MATRVTIKTISDAALARMRKMFNRRIIRIFLSRDKLYEWRQNEWIQNTINIIEAYNKNSTKNWTEDEINLTEMYEVGEKGGKKILRAKAEINGNKLLQIIPVEEYFDVIYDVHIKTDHGARYKMRDLLRKLNIYMPHAAVLWVMKLCKVCQSQRLAPTKRSVVATRKADVNHGFVELLDMSNTPDGEYKYVMYFRDMTTECTFLRPLRSPRVVEVAEELLKLFLQIGCPGILHTPTTEEFTEAIIQKLKVEWSNCLILNGRKMKSIKKRDKIEENIREWMVNNNSNKWSQGIFLIAHKMNLRKLENTNIRKSTPFKRLLGLNPKEGFETRGMKAVLKNVLHEEELEKIVHRDFVEVSDESEKEDEDETKNIGEILKKRAEKQQNPVKIKKLKNYTTIYHNNSYKIIKKSIPIDNSLPGPSKVAKQITSSESNTNQHTSLEKSTDLIEPKGIQIRSVPIKTYKRKSKIDAESISQRDYSTKTVTIMEQKQEYSISDEAGGAQQISNVKLKKRNDANDTKKQIKKDSAKKVNIENKVLCIDNNIKVRCFLKSDLQLSKQLRKRNESWNTSEIDLPAHPVKARRSIPRSILIDMEDLKTVSDFGEIPKECTDSFKISTLNVAAEKRDSFEKTEHVVSNKIGESPNFGKIVKVESIDDGWI